MRVSRRRFLGQSIATLALPRAAFSHSAPALAIEDVQLIDGSGRDPVTDARIVISGRTILAAGPANSVNIPAGARVISGKGGTVIPGLISGHVHLGGYDGLTMGPAAQNVDNILRQLNVYLRYGVTTVTSLGTNSEIVYDLRQRLSTGQARGADIYVADHGIGVPKGAPPAPLGPNQLDRPETPEAARAAVRAAASRGTNVIKLWLDDFQMLKLVKMAPEIYTAAIDEAHKAGLPAYVHIHYLEDAKAVLRAGADVLAHGVRDLPIDREFAELMKKNDAWYIPTLTVDDAFYLFAERTDLLDDPFVRNALHPDLLAQYNSRQWQQKQLTSSALPFWKRGLEMNKRNTLNALGRGINVGFGTDSGAMPLRVPGFAEHRELELLVEAGLTPLQALATATGQAARLLRLDDRGTIEAGKLADVVLLTADPLKDILATRDIQATWKKGIQVLS